MPKGVDVKGLIDMPNEILEEIFQLLSWTDLSHVHEIKNERIEKITKPLVDKGIFAI